MRARIVLSVVYALVLGWAGSAAADGKRIGVPRFDGPQEAVVRKAVMQVLKKEGFDVVGSREVDAAARSAGASLDSNEGFKAVAKELSISAFVTGEVAKKKAKLTVRNGADGAVSGEGSFAGAKPPKIAAEVRDGFMRRLGSAVSRGRAPSGAKKPTAAPAPVAEEAGGDEEEEAPAAKPPARKSAPAAVPAAVASSEDEDGDKGEKDEKKEEASAPDVVAKKAPSDEGDASAGAGPVALDISAGFRGFTRSLTYTQNLYRAPEYKLALGPAVAVAVVAYPASFATGSFVANLGLELSLEQAFGVASNAPNGGTYPTVIHDFSGGARLRFVLAGGHEIALVAGGGEQAFAFRSGDGLPRAELGLPDTIYLYARVGADVRIIAPGGVVIGLGGAYRHVLNHGGQISKAPFFPGLQDGGRVMGMDIHGMVGYQIMPSIEARVSVDLRRYGYSMNSIPEDVALMNKVAGGAVDQSFGFTLGAAYVFGGVPPGTAAAEDDEPPPEKKKAKKAKKKKSADEEEGDGEGEGDEDSED